MVKYERVNPINKDLLSKMKKYKDAETILKHFYILII